MQPLPDFLIKSTLSKISIRKALYTALLPECSYFLIPCYWKLTQQLRCAWSVSGPEGAVPGEVGCALMCGGTMGAESELLTGTARLEIAGDGDIHLGSQLFLSPAVSSKWFSRFWFFCITARKAYNVYSKARIGPGIGSKDIALRVGETTFGSR